VGRFASSAVPAVPGKVIVLSLLVLSSVRAPAEPVEIVRHDMSVDVLIGGQPFTTYYFDPSVAKPFLHPLRSAAGTIVTRGFPVTRTSREKTGTRPHQRPMVLRARRHRWLRFLGIEAAFPHWSHHAVSKFGRTVFRSLDEAERRERRRHPAGQLRFRRGTGVLGRQIQRYRFSGDKDTRVIDCRFSIVATTARSSWATRRKARLQFAS